jgi:hypothetical protein
MGVARVAGVIRSVVESSMHVESSVRALPGYDRNIEVHFQHILARRCRLFVCRNPIQR